MTTDRERLMTAIDDAFDRWEANTSIDERAEVKKAVWDSFLASDVMTLTIQEAHGICSTLSAAASASPSNKFQYELFRDRYAEALRRHNGIHMVSPSFPLVNKKFTDIPPRPKMEDFADKHDGMANYLYNTQQWDMLYGNRDDEETT